MKNKPTYFYYIIVEKKRLKNEIIKAILLFANANFMLLRVLYFFLFLSSLLAFHFCSLMNKVKKKILTNTHIRTYRGYRFILFY